MSACRSKPDSMRNIETVTTRTGRVRGMCFIACQQGLLIHRPGVGHTVERFEKVKPSFNGRPPA